jgi:hypothetical protein
MADQPQSLLAGADLSTIPDAPKPGGLLSGADLSAIPDAPKSQPFGFWQDETTVPPQLSEGMDTTIGADQKAPAFVKPPVPANLLRENAPQIQQDVWNQAEGGQPTVGPLRDQQLTPDVGHATGIRQNIGVGFGLGLDATMAKVVSLVSQLPGSPEEQGLGLTERPDKAQIYNATLSAMNKFMQIDKLEPPKDFADALARGVGESGAPLVETMALSTLTGGPLAFLTKGIAEKVPYLYSWLFPVAHDAITFGTQTALDPNATPGNVGTAAGAGAILGLLGPYGRAVKAMGGAAIGAGQEYLTNPEATPMDYARNAALMGAFAAIGSAHGITGDEAAAFTILDWAKGKYGDDAVARSLKFQGLGPLANEFAEDVTQKATGSLATQGAGETSPLGASVEPTRQAMPSEGLKTVSESAKEPWEMNDAEYEQWRANQPSEDRIRGGAPLSEDEKSLIGTSLSQLQGGETGGLRLEQGEEGAHMNVVGRYSSSYPDWFTGQGWSKKDAEAVYDKIQENKPLTENQKQLAVAMLQNGADYLQANGGPIMFRSVGPDTTQAVQDVANTLMQVARPAGLQRFWQRGLDAITIDPVPRMARVASFLADKAVEHASARIAAPKMVDGLLSSIFPNSYNRPEEMAKTVDLIVKDNVLGIWDQLNKRSQDSATAGDAAKADDWLEKAHALAREHDIDAYDAQLKAERDNPTAISDNIARWKQYWSGPGQLMERVFNEMKRVDPSTEREGRGRYFDARIQLTPETRAAKLQEYLGDESKPAPEPSQLGYLNPNVSKDQFDKMATGTGQYSTDARMNLLNSIVGRWNKVTELRFYDALVQSGAGVLLPAGSERPENIQGQDVSTFKARMPYTEILQDGGEKTTRVNSYDLHVRGDLAREVRAVLNIDMAPWQNPIFKIATAIQILQLADGFTHVKNIQTVISRAQGAGSAWQDIVRKMPILNTLDAWGRVYSVMREVMSDSPAIRDEIAQMAEKGLIRPEYPAQGVQAFTHMGELIHTVDTSSRIILNRFFDNLTDRNLAVDSDANRRGFINQVGMYNQRLMGPMMRLAKQTGLSPFIVAGRNFNKQGINAVTGNPMVEATSLGAAAQMRVTNLIGTFLFTAAVPMILNTLSTGTPMGRTGTPLFAWDFNGAEDEKGMHKVIDLADLIGLRRGMRLTGLNALTEGLRQGHTLSQITGQAGHDFLSSVAHPWEGPGLGFLLSSIFGKRTDLRGNMEAMSYPGEPVKQQGEYVRSALESQNPWLYSALRPLLRTMGIDQRPVNTGEAGKIFAKTENPWQADIENFLATTLKSPMSLASVKGVYPDRTAAEQMIADILHSEHGYEPGEQEHAELKRQIKLLERQGKEIPEELQDKFDEFGKGEEKSLERAEDTTTLQEGFSQLQKVDHMIKVLKVATPEERDSLEDIWEKKSNSALKNCAPAKQNDLENKIDKANELFERKG